MPNLVLIITHGHLGEGLLDSAAMICGQVDVARSLSYNAGTSPEDLDRQVDELLSECGEDNQLLFLTDLPGGTPSRIAAKFAAQGHAEAVTGVNLPMVIEVIQAAERRDIASLASLAVEKGRDGVIDIGRQIRAALSEEGTRS